MNWLLIVVLGIMVLCMFEGYHKGLLRMVFSMVIFVVVLTAGSFVTPYMKSFLCEYTGLEEQIRHNCQEYIRQKSEEQIAVATEELTNQATENGFKLPETWLDELNSCGVNFTYDLVEGTGLYDELAAAIADFAVGGAAYFLSLFVVYLVCYVMMRVLNLLTVLPGVKAVNKLSGLMLGLAKGLLIVWLMLYLISLFCASDFGGRLMHYIADSELLSWLYGHNFIMWFLSKILMG